MKIKLIIIIFLLIVSVSCLRKNETKHSVNLDDITPTLTSGINKITKEETLAMRVEANNNAGIEAAQSGDYEKAINFFSKAIELNPKSFKSYSNRGLIYSAMGKYELAIEDYSKALELNQEVPIVYINRANAYIQLDNYIDALIDCERVNKLNEKTTPQIKSMNYYTQGLVYLKLDKHKEALDNFNNSINIIPDFDYPYTGKGIVFYETGDYQKSIEMFKKSIEFSKNSEADYIDYFYLGKIYDRSNEYKNALKNYRKYLEIISNPKIKQQLIGDAEKQEALKRVEELERIVKNN